MDIHIHIPSWLWVFAGGTAFGLALGWTIARWLECKAMNQFGSYLGW